MWIPFSVAVFSVALGAALAALPGVVRHAIGPVRTFALAAALAVVAAHLLPEATTGLGALVIVGVGLGLAVPALGERLAVAAVRARGGSLERGSVAVHVSFAGLLVHQVGDGIGLWAFAGGEHPSLDVALALGAHTVPLTMLVVVAPLAAGRRGVAMGRALALALATCAGVGAGMLVPAAFVERTEPWIAAIAAGLLLHVMSHDMRLDAPRTARDRAIDLVAALVGVGLAVVGTLRHDAVAPEHDALAMRDGLLASVGDIARTVAPALVIGVAFGALANAPGPRSAPMRVVSICAPLVLWLTARMLGLESALGLASAALLGLMLVALMFGRVGGRPLARAARFTSTALGVLTDAGPWLVVAAVVAAFAQVLAHANGTPLEVAVVMSVLLPIVVAIPSYAAARSIPPSARVRRASAVALGLTTLVACGAGLALADATTPTSGAGITLYTGVGLALGLAMLVGVWRLGLRAWLASLAPGVGAGQESQSSVDTPHVHGPGCGHTHSLTPPPAVRHRA